MGESGDDDMTDTNRQCCPIMETVKARLSARKQSGAVSDVAEEFGHSLKRRRVQCVRDDPTPASPAEAADVAPYELEVEGLDGGVRKVAVDPTLPLRDTVLCLELLQRGEQLRLDGGPIDTGKSANDLRLANGTVLQAFPPQTGGAGEVDFEDLEAGLVEADFEAERQIEQQQPPPQPPPQQQQQQAAVTPRMLVQQPLERPASPFAFARMVTEGVATRVAPRVVVPDVTHMPALRGTMVPYPAPGAGSAATGEIDIEPKPSTQHSYGNITLATPEMGRGKTTAKNQYHKALIRDDPRARTLDLDCNRIFSTSNAGNLKKTATEMRDEGFAHVTAAGYLDDKQSVDLSKHQLVGCSFESLFKLEGQKFALITLDETSALATKIGGGTMPHFECVFVLRHLLAEPGTRVLALDAGAGFKMSDTEPNTVVEDFFKLVAPHRKVLTVTLDPNTTPEHLKRKLRIYCGAEEGQNEAWWAQLKKAFEEWQTDNSKRVFVPVGTISFGKKLAKLAQEWCVPYQFYNGDSNEQTRFRDLAEPGRFMRDLGCVICTTVLGRGVDLPQALSFHRVLVAFDSRGCDFGDLFQSVLRVRHVMNQTVDALLIKCYSKATRALLETQGKCKRIERPTYEQELQQQKARRAYALRAVEREVCAAGVAICSRAMAPATDPLLRVMAHATLNRAMQLADPLHAVERLADHYRFPVEPAVMDANGQEPQSQGGAAPELDEDTTFADLMEPKEKLQVLVQHIREHGEHGFFDSNCYGLATDEKKKSKELTTFEQWLLKVYYALKNIGELPAREDGDDAQGGGAPGEDSEDNGDDDPAVATLLTWLGAGAYAADLTPSLQLQAHCRLFSPEEQLKRDRANSIASQASRKPDKHAHCELSIGQQMVQVANFGRLLLPDNFSHVRQVFQPAPVGILDDPNIRLVEAANREILTQMTMADESAHNELQQIKAALNVPGKKTTIIDLLRALAKPMGLRLLKPAYVQETQPDGTRKRLVRSDPGLRFERVLPDVVDKWLIRSVELDAMVRVADWQRAHAEQQQQRAEDAWGDAHDDFGDEAVTSPMEDGAGAVGGNPNVRCEYIPDDVLQEQLRQLQAGYDAGAWMDAASRATRVAWSAPQRARYGRHLSTTNALNAAKAIDREAGPADEATGWRKLHVVYGKNSLGLGRRTASAPSMQNCPSTLRRALCHRLYHDIDIVSCHPTLMLQVVRKMVENGSIQWCDALNKLAEYAELDANGAPTGRMPLLLRVADFFGIDRSVAKDVCKTLVLRVLNGGQVLAWCREMNIAMPDGEPQPDLEDLVEVARLVRQAFFAMLERDHPGSLEQLQQRVWAHLQGKHARQVQAARHKGETPPQRPSVAKRDRTMFSLCIFNLEDAVLDCIDVALRERGWAVDSLIYDGLHVRHRDDDAGMADALRAAEQAVKTKLGYVIALTEKPLYVPG